MNLINFSIKRFAICVLLLILSSINAANAWMARARYASKAHVGKCKIADTIIISPGETVKSPDICANIRCDNVDGWGTIVGCGAIGAPPNCEWGVHIDAEAPYPSCCARKLICEPSKYEAAVVQKMQDNVRSMLGLDKDADQ